MVQFWGTPVSFLLQGHITEAQRRPYRDIYRIRYIFPWVNDQAGQSWEYWAWRGNPPHYRQVGATTPESDYQLISDWLRYAGRGMTRRYVSAGPGVAATNAVVHQLYLLTLEMNRRGLWPFPATPVAPGNILDREPPNRYGLTYRR